MRIKGDSMNFGSEGMFDIIKRASHAKTKEIVYVFVAGIAMWFTTLCLYAVSDQTWNNLGAIGSLLAGVVSVGAGLWGVLTWIHNRNSDTVKAIEQVKEFSEKIEYFDRKITSFSSKVDNAVKASEKTDANQRVLIINYNHLKSQNNELQKDLNRLMDFIMRRRIDPVDGVEMLSPPHGVRQEPDSGAEPVNSV